MDEQKKGLKLKLSLDKETLRELDESQLHLLDEAVGGLVEDDCGSFSCRTSNCPGSCGEGSCKG